MATNQDSIPAPLKRCYRCKEQKSRADFHKDRRNPSGLQAACRSCASAYKAKVYVAHPRVREALPAGTKRCANCREVKEYSGFTLSKITHDRRTAHCRLCISAKARAKYLTRTERRTAKDREAHRRWKYGLTAEQFSAMLAAQRGCCAICGEHMGTPCVDHDHTTEKVRGLLCKECNWAIGFLHDNAVRMDRAAAYIREHQRKGQ